MTEEFVRQRAAPGQWWVDRDHGERFADLGVVYRLEGPMLSASRLGHVIYVRREEQGYYVKRYWHAGGHLENWFGVPRVQREWRNLRYFRRLGLPVPDLVAFGLERRRGQFLRGALITREVAETIDLAEAANRQDSRLSDRHWLRSVSEQIADALARMHADGFCHNDMKWRNLLVTAGDQPVVYFIDCPAGRRWWGPFLAYRRVKDLACMDKIAKYQLSRTARLRFYLRYKQQARLDAASKKEIRKVLRFFAGRE